MTASETKRPTDRPGSFTKGLRQRHFQGRSSKGKRLAAQAESACQRRVDQLKREHAKSKAAQVLAAKLENCRPKHRCLSGACPVCAQAAQELFVEMAKALAAEGSR